MAFADALADQQRTIKGPSCSVGALLDNLDDDQADEVRSAIHNHSVQLAAISRAIRAEFGAQVGTDAVSRHRRGDCTCEARYGVR